MYASKDFEKKLLVELGFGINIQKCKELIDYQNEVLYLMMTLSADGVSHSTYCCCLMWEPRHRKIFRNGNSVSDVHLLHIFPGKETVAYFVAYENMMVEMNEYLTQMFTYVSCLYMHIDFRKLNCVSVCDKLYKHLFRYKDVRIRICFETVFMVFDRHALGKITKTHNSIRRMVFQPNVSFCQ
jgi:hypothetical protein